MRELESHGKRLKINWQNRHDQLEAEVLGKQQRKLQNHRHETDGLVLAPHRK